VPEILLAFELAEFFEFNLEEHKVSVGGKTWDVDILLPSQDLAVEYDGAYYHHEKQDSDTRKLQALEGAGYRVIRAREAPLEPLGPNDIVFPLGDIKECVNRVLQRIVDLGLDVDNLSRYLQREDLANEKRARRFINTLLKKKAASKNNL